MVDLVHAVTALARELGVTVQAPVPLRSTNNLVLWLAPSDVVAKIARTSTRLGDELTNAQALAALGAPVVPPAPELGRKLYQVGDHDVTFWTYVAQEGFVAPSSQSVASALAALHASMVGLGALPELGLPQCEKPIDETISSLHRPAFASALRNPDRELLLDALSHGRRVLNERHRRWQPIHGSPHRLNILVANGEPRFIDFETVAWGPVEWDLAHLEPEVAAHYPTPFDEQLLGSLRIVVSCMTSAQCWNALDRGPDMREHALHHLSVVRAHRQNPNT
jgi:hypothetical protein